MREYVREIVAYRQRIEDEAVRDTTLAWLIESMQRRKELPKLESLVDQIRSRRLPQDHKAMLHRLSAAYKIPLRKGTTSGV